jgi:DNA-binding IclR family transcriptional regulator
MDFLSMNTKSGPIPGTQVLRRSAQILRLIALHPRSGVRVIDVAQSLQLEPPTAHRLLQGLIQERMVQHDADTRRYFLGPALYELGLAAAPRFDLLEYLQPSILRLTAQTGDTVVATVRSGYDGICIAHHTGEFPIRTSVVSVGTRRPLTAGAGGLAIASTMDDDEIDRLAQENAERLSVEPRQLVARVREARLQGYSVNMYRRTSPGITALGIPVIGAYGQCVAGIGVIALSSRLYGKRRNEVLDLLRTESAVMTLVLTESTAP